MSKTLGSILLVAAAVAVNVIPGAGQAISGAILTTVGTSFAAVGIVTTAVSILSVGLAVVGAQAAMGLLGIGPHMPKPEQTESPIKSPTPARVSAYGRVRLHYAYALFETAANGTAVDVGAVHDGRIDGYEQFYLGDDKVTLSGNTVNAGADGRYKDSTIHIYTTLGNAVETAFSAVTSLLPGIWTSDHRGDGVATMAVTFRPVKAKHYQETYPSGLPPAGSAVLRAQPVFDWRDTSQSVGDPLTWKWSENFILHIAHYLLTRKLAVGPTRPPSDPDYWADIAGMYGAVWAIKFTPTLSYWTAAADDADLPTPLKGGGTEPRYRSCLAHKHTDQHKTVLSGLLACGDGWMSPRHDGAIIIYSGRYYEPTVSIGPDEIVSYSFEDGLADEDSVNEIALTYISAAHDFNAVETDAWRDEDDIAARGRVNSVTVSNQVPSHSQARRLAKRYMAKAMAPMRGTVTTNSGGRVAVGQRYINLTIDEGNGFAPYEGPAEITQLTRNLATGGVTFAWVAADPNIDAWNPATEEGDPAPVGNRVALAPLDAPVISSATAAYGYDSATGAPGVYLVLAIDAPDRSDLTWFLRTRASGAAIWGERQYSDIDASAAVALATEFVPVDAMVEVEAAFMTGDGRVSPWSATETVSTSSAAIPPAAPTDLSATAGAAGDATFEWRNPSTSNLAYLRVYRGTTAVLGSATLVSGDLVGGLSAVMTYPETGLSAGTYYYWVRAYNIGGYSSVAGPVSVIVT